MCKVGPGPSFPSPVFLGGIPAIFYKFKIFLISVNGGTVELGKKVDSPLYGWDNEFGSHISDVWDFSASQFLVSNQEYLEFVEDGGYSTQEYWTGEGWAWYGSW